MNSIAVNELVSCSEEGSAQSLSCRNVYPASQEGKTAKCDVHHITLSYTNRPRNMWPPASYPLVLLLHDTAVSYLIQGSLAFITCKKLHNFIKLHILGLHMMSRTRVCFREKQISHCFLQAIV